MRDRITLCIIAGNVEHYIERFIRSFAPLAGRIVIVTARGCSESDGTIETAIAVCDEIGLDWQYATYGNGYEHTDWPHVDDFAAARNLAFSLAKTEWIAWADTDDVLQPGSAEAIHETLVKHGENLDGVTFPYEVPDDGLTVMKERILRNGCGSWRYRVHEEFKFNSDKPRLGSVHRATIVHLPRRDRKSNDERNVRLLEAMGDERPVGHEFHYAQSLRAVGRTDDSVRVMSRLVMRPEVGSAERYELYINLGQLAKDEPTRGQMFLQALAVDPSRREAYGDLALFCIRHLQAEKALSWTRAMLAIPCPRRYIWNARAKFYGWCGIMLHTMALRLNGDAAGANAHERNHFLAHGATISLLHATRGRPKQAYEAKIRWLESAANPDAVEHLFSIDQDDQPSMVLTTHRHVLIPPGGGCVRAWNAAASASLGQVLIQLSDDWDPPQHWDALILERLGDLTQPKVLAISDGHRTDDLLCMAILTRARYEQQGYLFHPEFLSMYSDNWFTHCAHRDRVVIDARDLVFEHKHPAFDATVPVDQTYAESNTPDRYAQGKATLDRLIAEDSRA